MKVLIIGGGMSGLTYGILAVKNGINAVLCERNPRVGKKIAVTGNGKCNIGNINVDKHCFNNSGVASAVLDDVTVEDYLRFLQSCGIYTKSDGEGRLYPLSESASNVVDCLRHQFVKYGGEILCDCNVASVKGEKGRYTALLNGREVVFDRVVLACGSASGAQAPDIFGIAPQKWFTKLCPSLVPVKISNMDKSLNGLRAKAAVTLLKNGKKVRTEQGEVQFKDYGISGICVYNLSAYIARDVVAGQECAYDFSLDLVPQLSQQQLVELLSSRQSDAKNPPSTYFYGILHNKIAESVLKKSSANAENIAKTAKNFTLRFEKLLDFSMSQVTCGGIDEKFVDAKNLTLPNGIVALGEVLNVDGLSGGNNLYFAAASALHLFDSAARKTAFDKK